MPTDIQALKGTIEAAIEELVRLADTKINWTNGAGKGYIFLPGVYQWHADKAEVAPPVEAPPTETLAPSEPPQLVEVEATDGAVVPDVPASEPVVVTDQAPEAAAESPPKEQPPAPIVDDEKRLDRELAQVAAFLMNDDDIVSMSFTLTLHGDNTFEYLWKQKRAGARPMEHKVELYGSWSKPVLNRDRYGERDSRLFLDTHRARFTRLANYDATTGVWRQTLRTLTRNGEDYVVCGQNDRGLPPIRLVFTVLDGNILESNGLAFPHDIVSNSISSRILSGLTKKAANKLGTPLDVMTDRWLPCRKLCLKQLPYNGVVTPFNPLVALAEILHTRGEAANPGSCLLERKPSTTVL
ncbi:hypothetical protein SPRG_04807 [Saprolegnia parasitica CBS 223.65]|uniref:Uncharacterized protein n=1 Tax=Saprolegnia parasitica (strain CBS 223.65) TaxID=695850 RepID=A0A067CJI4_SAPPC|nr:hypothetical protein SPRG_04807 [Saprolegnia parasitica CBS 223.65]KDO30904.1 hypothetical protein SPRG_04807 [Saprolegnia parasitica CBS 223.65]|eukprot:XP_012198597.1 hypothetical protein SPRG_04807 [Saprolegnia parasitica CBS 223.65]